MMMMMIAIYRSYVVGVFRGFATVTKSLPLPVNPHTHTNAHRSYVMDMVIKLIMRININMISNKIKW